MNPAQTCADITPVELQVCRGLLCSYLPPHPPARATPAPAAQVSPPRQSRGVLSACHAAPTHWPKPERGGAGGLRRQGAAPPPPASLANLPSPGRRPSVILVERLPGEGEGGGGQTRLLYPRAGIRRIRSERSSQPLTARGWPPLRGRQAREWGSPSAAARFALPTGRASAVGQRSRTQRRGGTWAPQIQRPRPGFPQ